MRVILLSLLLSGCAVEAPIKAPVADKDCLSIAKYVRGIVNLRDIGVRREDLSAFTSEPVVLSFPLQMIQAEVFGHSDVGGEQMAKRFYDKCTEVGYSNLIGSLRASEQARRPADLRPGKEANPKALELLLKAGKR